MELKKYQKQVLGDLDAYLKSLGESAGLAGTWRGYWESKGLLPPQAYHDDIPGAANVCVKVPTGGGKTFIASCALKHIFDHVPVGKTRFVVWLVPSDAILSQTVANLSNPEHPYRQRINMDFSGKVNVYTKDRKITRQNDGKLLVQISDESGCQNRSVNASHTAENHHYENFDGVVEVEGIRLDR